MRATLLKGFYSRTTTLRMSNVLLQTSLNTLIRNSHVSWRIQRYRKKYLATFKEGIDSIQIMQHLFSHTGVVMRLLAWYARLLFLDVQGMIDTGGLGRRRWRPRVCAVDLTGHLRVLAEHGEVLISWRMFEAGRGAVKWRWQQSHCWILFLDLFPSVAGSHTYSPIVEIFE